MNIRFFRSLSFQVIAIIILVLAAMTFIQYKYSEKLVDDILLSETKKQALVFLLGVERQIQALDDPYNGEKVLVIFQEAIKHDISTLGFSILNLYCYDSKGSVFAYIQEPEEFEKNLQEKYGDVIRENSPYMGKEVEGHHYDEQGNEIPSIDVIIPIHHSRKIIGGLEVEIDLNKMFAMANQLDNEYENRIIIMLLITMALFFIFVFFIIHYRLLVPVNHLGDVTGRIAAGELSARVDYDVKNEIGVLGNSINKMAKSIERLFDKLDDTYFATLNALTEALEAKDNYTANHSQNVSNCSLKLAQQIGLGDRDMKILAEGAMLHDLGKIGISDVILNKPEPLADEEYEIIMQHPRMTENILKPLEEFKNFSEIARSHHERWDGMGYPDGLRGEQIPLLARIVAIADSWDAMVGDRKYRKGMGEKKALEIFEKEINSGQWDPKLVAEFVQLMKKEIM